MSAQGQKSEHDNVATEKKQPKERRFVDAKTGKTIEKPKHGGSGAAATQALRDEMHAERAGNALPFRIGAAVLWAVGIALEVAAILVANSTLYLPKLPAAGWVVIFLVIDLIAVVAGSQLWKRANHLAPASKENKLAYWVRTELGVIVAVIAFAPMIVLTLANKDMDEKSKQVCSIVAGIALLVAVGSGIDFHPTSQEDIDQAEAGAAVLSDDGLAYWTPFGEVYHFNPDCQYIKNSGTIYSGTMSDALEAGRNRACSGCAVADGDDLLENADPAAVEEAAANAFSVIEGNADMSPNATGADEDATDADTVSDDDLLKAA